MFASMLTTLFAAAAAKDPVPQSEVKLDFFLLQDLSSSYDNDLVNIVRNIPKVITNLASEYPHSRFGFGSFVDKPIHDFGYEVSGDYCYKQHFALSELKVGVDAKGQPVGMVVSEDKDFQLGQILNNLTVHSGKDWKENQLGALLHAISTSRTGWNREEDENRVNIVALATDAGYHEAGDGAKHGLLHRVGMYKNDPEEWCLTEDYPSLNDIERALEMYNTNLLLLVTDDLVAYYQKFLDSIGGRGVVVSLDKESKFIDEAIKAGISYMSENGFNVAAGKTIAKLIKEEADKLAESHVGQEVTEAPTTTARPTTTAAPVVRPKMPNAVYAAKHQPTVVPDHNEVLAMCPQDTVFEVMIVQDASDSYTQEIDSLREQLDSVWTKVSGRYPGSKIGLTSFVDKPMEPFGYAESGDYCAALRVPLSAEVSKVTTNLSKMVVRSGSDWKEAQLHGIMHGLYAPNAGWSTNPFNVDDKKVVRVAVTITDAGYHVAGDSGLKSNNGDEELDCVGEDYPSTNQVAAALKKTLAFPVFLVTGEVQAEYEELLHNKLKLNGSVIAVDGAGSRVAKVETGLLHALSAVCNQTAIASDIARHKSQTTQDAEGVHIHIDQMPKYMAIIAKD